MQFNTGAKVVTADGEQAGSVDRVVLDPETKEVTHLVVRKGILFTEDKVVPMSLVGPSTKEQVTLRQNAGDLEDFPVFEESHFVHANRRRRPEPEAATHQAPGLFWYPPVGYSQSAGGFARTPGAGYVHQTRRNIPEGTVAIEAGARVIGSDGEHLGDVERVVTDPQANRVTHFLISEGLILKEKRLIPTDWITNFGEGALHLSVGSEFVDSLPEYENS